MDPINSSVPNSFLKEVSKLRATTFHPFQTAISFTGDGWEQIVLLFLAERAPATRGRPQRGTKPRSKCRRKAPGYRRFSERSRFSF